MRTYCKLRVISVGFFMSQPKSQNRMHSLLGGAGALACAVIPLTFSPAAAMAPIIVSGMVDIHFGSFTESGAGGTVVINPAGGRTVGGAVMEVGGGGLEQRGRFNVTGSTGMAMDVDVTPTSVTISNGGDTMVVNNFNLITVGGGDSATITLAAASSQYYIGATLVVGAGQASGTYSGNYTLTVNYQ